MNQWPDPMYNEAHKKSQEVYPWDCPLCQIEEPIYRVNWDDGGSDWVHESQLGSPAAPEESAL